MTARQALAVSRSVAALGLREQKPELALLKAQKPEPPDQIQNALVTLLLSAAEDTTPPTRPAA